MLFVFCCYCTQLFISLQTKCEWDILSQEWVTLVLLLNPIPKLWCSTNSNSLLLLMFSYRSCHLHLSHLNVCSDRKRLIASFHWIICNRASSKIGFAFCLNTQYGEITICGPQWVLLDARRKTLYVVYFHFPTSHLPLHHHLLYVNWRGFVCFLVNGFYFTSMTYWKLW